MTNTPPKKKTGEVEKAKPSVVKKQSKESRPKEEPTKEAVIEILKSVEDPELFIDIYTLELIYDVIINPKDIKVVMTLTSPQCPAGEVIPYEIKEKIKQKYKHIKKVEVQITFSPPWQPSEDLRAMLGLGGTM
jgi:metal-sulfur cluster biosynthetic enzyme